MADAFDKFKSSLNRGITTINVKASSFSEKTKIKTHIDTLNADIQKLYTEIGQTAFNKWQNSDPDNSVLLSLFEQIQAKQDNIVQLNNEMAAIDERDNQILGAKAEKPATAPAIVCPSCGAGYDAPVKFCRSCGFKMPE